MQLLGDFPDFGRAVDASADTPPPRLLLVEDSAGDASLVRSALDEAPRAYDVVWTTTLAAALVELRERAFTCVVADLGLPDADGVEVVRQLRTADADVPLIVLTGRSNDEDGLDAIRCGADDYLQKSDLTPQQLHRVLGYAVERSRARRVAHASAHFQGALLAAIGQAVVVSDRDGRIVYWNASAEQMFDRPAADALGRHVADVVATDRRLDRDSDVLRQLHAGRTHTADVDMRRRDGSEFPGMVTDAPVFDSDGRLSAVISLYADMTERRQAEDTARALSAIVESSADAIFTKRLDGIVQSWNRGAEQLYGYAAADIVGQHVSLLELPDRPEVEQILDAVRTGQTVEGFETLRRRRDGSQVAVSLTVSPMFNEAGSVVAASVIARDMTDRRALEDELLQQAVYDSLTGLPNRVLLEDRLGQALRATAREHSPVAVLFCDLDHFKRINDRDGHLAGDELLQQVAQRLLSAVRPCDTVARFGGDEFVIVCADTDVTGAEQVAERLIESLREPVVLAGRPYHVSVSVGIAVTPPASADAATLLSHADAAMYGAKSGGRARWRVFDEVMAARSSERLSLGEDLREALDADALELHYQPQVEIATGRVVGLEALLRWNCPGRGWVPPALFVGVAEENGFVRDLDRWVLLRACRDIAALRLRNVVPADARIAVNQSGASIVAADFAETVITVARAARLPLAAFEVEVTETGLLTDLESAHAALTRLRELGASVALDDFGTGYSSLSYVRQFPVSTIKIDRSFVANIAADGDDRAIAASIVDLGRGLDLRTVAEGVETDDQLAVLQRLGCTSGQGYLWSPAAPLPEVADLLRRSAHSSASGELALPSGQLSAPPPVATNAHGRHLILQMHRDGASLATIAAALNARGYRTPTGVRWHRRTVARVTADATASPDAKAG